MLEYTGKYWKMFIPLIKKSLIKRSGREYTKELINKTNIIYKEMLKKAPDVGKDNPMASIYMKLL